MRCKNYLWKTLTGDKLYQALVPLVEQFTIDTQIAFMFILLSLAYLSAEIARENRAIV